MTALVVFSLDLDRLASFYSAVLDATARVETSGDVRVINGQHEVLVHTMPGAFAPVAPSPERPREDVALKPVFDVVSLNDALAAVTAHGGKVTELSFTLEGRARHDVLDPDGNLLQLRSRVP